MTKQVWVETHPYLQSIAAFHAQVEFALDGISIPQVQIPRWDHYTSDFRIGVPLLHSPRAGIDIRPAGTVVTSLIEALASGPLPDLVLGEEVRSLATELRGKQDAPSRAVIWLIHEDGFVAARSGLLRYLGWTVLARFLSPVVTGFGSWRDEEQWLHGYCPTCGSLPAMAQLVGSDPGRLRLLCCGCCGTRWRYRRMACPFCENQDGHRLAVLYVEGEKELRIDYCEHCAGYLKTYNGEGRESVLLKDWTSLHLDIMAGDRGLKRLAASLYQL